MSKVKKANFNGFYVEHNPRFSFNQLDGINDNVCMGGVLDDLWSKAKETASTAVKKAEASVQTSIVNSISKTVNNALGIKPPQPTLPTAPNNVQNASQVQAQEQMAQNQVIYQTQTVSQPLDPNIKLALMAGGGLVGLVLLLTTIKSLTK